MNAQIAQHLNVAESAIIRVEEWASVLFVVCRKIGARFVSKKIVKKVVGMNCVQVETFKEKVVVDTTNQVGYVIRSGFDVGNFYYIKKFNPEGIDIRGLDYSSVNGESLPDKPQDKDRSHEYNAVMSAIGFGKPTLIAYGMPGDCRYPSGYRVEK